VKFKHDRSTYAGVKKEFHLIPDLQILMTNDQCGPIKKKLIYFEFRKFFRRFL